MSSSHLVPPSIHFLPHICLIPNNGPSQILKISKYNSSLYRPYRFSIMLSYFGWYGCETGIRFHSCGIKKALKILNLTLEKPWCEYMTGIRKEIVGYNGHNCIDMSIINLHLTLLYLQCPFFPLTVSYLSPPPFVPFLFFLHYFLASAVLNLIFTTVTSCPSRVFSTSFAWTLIIPSAETVVATVKSQTVWKMATHDSFNTTTL